MIDRLTLGSFSDRTRGIAGRDTSSMLNRVIDVQDGRTYFSGSDCRFEINGIPVDDVAQIGYNLVEPVKAHYGYARRTRARVSRGQRLVSGQIIFNFRDSSQIYYLLNKIKNGLSVDETGQNPKSRQEVLNQIAGTNGNTSRARQLISATKGANNSVSDALRVTNAKPNKDKIEQFRDAMWGVKGATDPYASNAPELDTRLGSTFQGFNLRIIFGEPDFQNPRTNDTSDRQLGTVILIAGVELTGESFEVTETGEPVRMLYPFIAADVNNLAPGYY